MYTANTYCLAESAAQAYDLLQSDRKNAIVGGNLWMRMGKGAYNTLIDLSRLGLDVIAAEDGFLTFGAMTSFRTVETSALAERCFGPVLREALSPIVGTQFRSLATVGGTVSGRYGFSDLLNAALALDAEVEFYRAGRMPLAGYLS